MTFKEQITADAISVFLNQNEIGETITYTPVGGSAKSVRAVIERAPELPYYFNDGSGLEVTAEVCISNDATHGVTSPGHGDAVTFGGDDYFVVKITPVDLDGMYTLGLMKTDITEKGAARLQR